MSHITTVATRTTLGLFEVSVGYSGLITGSLPVAVPEWKILRQAQHDVSSTGIEEVGSS